jgi:two-component system sensor histidine kinase KdpD
MNQPKILFQRRYAGFREMNPRLRVILQAAGSTFLLWATGALTHRINTNRVIAAMVELLAVLAIATLGDWILALFSSIVATTVYTLYFIDRAGARRLTGIEAAITFGTMAMTALIGSQLSVRAQRLAQEAIHRREEMERLNQLGRVLLAANTLAEAAAHAVREVVELFGLRGAALRVEGVPDAFLSGDFRPAAAADQISIVPLSQDPRADVLELHGARLSEEVRSALASMIRLVLERARSAEQRAESEAIRRVEALRSTVLNALAHDFKTPLTSIKAAASMLRVSGASLHADQRELVAVIDEEADRLARLIRESLDLAKLEGRRAHPATEECEISGIVDRVTARMSRQLGGRKFIIEIPEDLPPITGDSFLLEQMLLQVVDNAWKYSRPGTPIRISCVLASGNIVLTVCNEGSEIPEEERERIFDKFYRGSRDRGVVEGTGMGLVIARTIAEAYQGKIWLDMEPEGPAFRFALPFEATGEIHDREPHHITH